MLLTSILLDKMACHKQAERPDTKGAEKDVPLAYLIDESWSATTTDIPLAHTFGLILPSKDGPLELNEAMLPR